jgi:hypothetical protein
MVKSTAPTYRDGYLLFGWRLLSCPLRLHFPLTKSPVALFLVVLSRLYNNNNIRTDTTVTTHKSMQQNNAKAGKPYTHAFPAPSHSSPHSSSSPSPSSRTTTSAGAIPKHCRRHTARSPRS